jgi:hypothetical protein
MPRCTAVLDGCVLAPRFADEILRLMADPLDGT